MSFWCVRSHCIHTQQLTRARATAAQLLRLLEDHTLSARPRYRPHRQELRAHALDTKPSDDDDAHALPPPSDPEQVKLARMLLDRLKYCKEVLVSIRNANASAGVGSGGGVSAKPSKASLR
jgi:hypothetical protein